MTKHGEWESGVPSSAEVMPSAIADKKPIEKWWADNPMTYGADHGSTVYVDPKGASQNVELGSPEFFATVDETFHGWNHPLHDNTGFFGKVFPYAAFKGKDVLELGCGMGTMASHWARNGSRVHAVDLNPVAVAMTTRRMEMMGLSASVQSADANVLPFANASFDYVYSWGVLHHSPDLDRSVDELFRVLRPGGQFGVMLYHRDSILQRYQIEWTEGYLHGESQFLDPVALASRYGDGDRDEGNPHTWPVTRGEMQEMFGRHSNDLGIRTLGTELDFMLENIFPIPGLAKRIPAFIKKPWARRWGWSLWMHGTKR